MEDIKTNEVVGEQQSQTQAERTYTQSDVDNIMNKVRTTEQNKFNEKLNNLNNQVQSLKQEQVKKAFEENGGLNTAFEDFTKSNPELFEINDFNQLNQKVQEIKSNKSFFFQSQPNHTYTESEEKMVKDTFYYGDHLKIIGNNNWSSNSKRDFEAEIQKQLGKK